MINIKSAEVHKRPFIGVEKLTTARLKALKHACYKSIGHHFWCCEFHCELDLSRGRDKEYGIFKNNMRMIGEELERRNTTQNI